MAMKKEMCSSENHEPGAGIVLMKLEELHSFEGHPFKVERNQELFELRCSIEKEGVLVPLLVRKNPHGDGYEIIAGHRRKEAALWAGLTEVPVIIRELDDDQSVIAMVDSNLQREKILPSEKAFAYKMRLEAMKHQGRLESDTSDPLEPRYKTKLVNVSELEAEIQKLGKVKIQKKDGAGGKRSNEQLASMVGESVTQIKRYIRLTHLIPKILDMVDKEILAIRSAVEISFLSEEEQYELHAVMELEHSIPNISQANRLKRMSQQKCLDMDKIYEILQEIKPNQKEQIKLPLERIGKYFPTDYTPAQQMELENLHYAKDLTHLLYASQVLQGMAIKYGVDHWRRNRGRCMGTLYWQINDDWPAPSWSSIDYFGRWKALHYMAQKFYAPHAVSMTLEDHGATYIFPTNPSKPGLLSPCPFVTCRECAGRLPKPKGTPSVILTACGTIIILLFD